MENYSINIKIIIKMSVIIILLSPSHKCIWCDYVLKNYDSIIKNILLVSNYRFPMANHETKSYQYPPIIVHDKKIDPIYPKELLNYHIEWSPMFMLVDGNAWDNGKLENVRVMNSTIVDNKIKYKQIYDIRKHENFTNWLKETEPVKSVSLEDTQCSNVLNLLDYY